MHIFAQYMPLHRLQHSKYADYMQKICKKYAQSGPVTVPVIIVIS